jgi:iron(II)-dependent oxidoreductase
MVLLLVLALVPPAEADSVLPFNSSTYSADEDCRWALWGAEAPLQQIAWNAGYISPPPGGHGDEHYWDLLVNYRNAVHQGLHQLGEVELNYRGIRAWTRMRAEVARALDLRPGQPFRIEVAARWFEGNGQLVLALDLIERDTGRKRGWSGVFSTLDIPRDGHYHELTWAGTLPDFDHDSCYAKLIFGMDATHDPAPGRVQVHEFALTVPELPAEIPSLTAEPGYDPGIYERPDLAWASDAFVCHFTFMYDQSFYDRQAGRYRVDEFLDEGMQQFGGYDAVVLWHAYPRIGVDERNQFDFYRDMPGGLTGLRRVVRQLHQCGVKVFIDYNPWDTGTRREDVPDEQAIGRMVEALNADGVFLDTMTAANRKLREAVDAAKPGVVFEPEGSPPIDQLELCNASWAQGLPELPEPGLLRLRWIEPRHMQHQINRWAGSHQRELENAFFNGSGILVWENVFGTWNPWSPEDRATLRRMGRSVRFFRRNFRWWPTSPYWPTLIDGVYANCWSDVGVTVWTIVNRTGRELDDALFLAGEDKWQWFDLWNGERLDAEPASRGLVRQAEREHHPVWGASRDDPVVAIRPRLGPIGSVAAISSPRMLKRVERLLAEQRSEAAWAPEANQHSRAASVIDPYPPPETPPASPDDPPPGMVLVPAGSVTMNLTHKRRECGCYPDPGTPPERWRDFLWGSPHNGTIAHHIGPVDLPAFFIDEHEVTNAEFARFLQDSDYRPKDPTNFLKHWNGGREPPPELADHPVVYVDLDDARAYARWAGKRLPTELEWHRAAQGDDGRKWPWGDEFDASRCNGPSGGTTPVTAHPAGRSPFGCNDMAGNVWEWTESERSDGHTRFCIIRGGSYYRAEGSIWYVQGGPQPCTSHAKFILMYPGLDRCSTIGFRCVRDVAAD